MKDQKKIETIEMIFEDFVKQMEFSNISRYLVDVYQELGIEP